MDRRILRTKRGGDEVHSTAAGTVCPGRPADREFAAVAPPAGRGQPQHRMRMVIRGKWKMVAWSLGLCCSFHLMILFLDDCLARTRVLLMLRTFINLLLSQKHGRLEKLYWFVNIYKQNFSSNSKKKLRLYMCVPTNLIEENLLSDIYFNLLLISVATCK